MTLRELLAEGEHVLQTAGIEDWKMDAWYLLEETLEVTRTRYLVDSGKAVSEEEKTRYLEQIDKRASHIPLQHLTGHQEFMGLDFQVSEDVLHTLERILKSYLALYVDRKFKSLKVLEEIRR